MKRILSIDGGGIRGVIPARLLSHIEVSAGKPISELFDLIVGTSTGGLIALGLTAPGEDGKTPKYSAADLVSLYNRERKNIFPNSLWDKLTSLGGIGDEVYDHEGLEGVLEDYFGVLELGQLINNVMVTSYDIRNRKPLFFKNWHDDFKMIQVRHAARATSAAPTYFEPKKINIDGKRRVLVDGGIFINSPGVSALAEARRIFPSEEDFFLLSIGTGEHTRSITHKKAKEWGIAGWAKPLLSCIFDGVSDAADYQLQLLLGDERYARIQTTLSVASDDMDDVSRENMERLDKEVDTMLKDELVMKQLKKTIAAIQSTPSTVVSE